MIRLEDIFFFDLETTGIDPSTAGAVQIAYKSGDKQNDFILNPGRPIAPGASAVHGITEAMVQDLPGFASYAQELAGEMDGKYWCAYNGITFDIPIIRRLFEEVGYQVPTCKGKLDPYKIFCHYEGNPTRRGTRTLMAAHIHYCGCEFDGAHDALSDIIAMVNVYEEQVRRYGFESFIEIGNRAELEIGYRSGFQFHHDDKLPIITFGKHAGKYLSEVPVDYLQWIVTGSTCSPDCKKIAAAAIKGHFPVFRKN